MYKEGVNTSYPYLYPGKGTYVSLWYVLLYMYVLHYATTVIQEARPTYGLKKFNQSHVRTLITVSENDFFSWR